MKGKFVERGMSPIPFDRYETIKRGLKDGEYVVMNHLQDPNQALMNLPPPPPQPPTHYLRNGLLVGGLGAGIGALYRYRQPLMKLGQKAISYVSDKFHNLYKPANETALTVNPHNW